MEFGTAHGALAMTTRGDTSMASLAEVQALAAGPAPASGDENALAGGTGWSPSELQHGESDAAGRTGIRHPAVLARGVSTAVDTARHGEI